MARVGRRGTAHPCTIVRPPVGARASSSRARDRVTAASSAAKRSAAQQETIDPRQTVRNRQPCSVCLQRCGVDDSSKRAIIETALRVAQSPPRYEVDFPAVSKHYHASYFGLNFELFWCG